MENHLYAFVAVIILAAGIPAAAAPAFDIVIQQGRIVDGTGSPWYVADVGIRDGRIVKIGRIDVHDRDDNLIGNEAGDAAQGRDGDRANDDRQDGDACRVIDAKGLVVAPGFVDMMGQTATPMLDNPETAINLLTQGITTINAGEGRSAAPLSESAAKRRGWRTMAEYFQLLELKGLPVNVVQTVGHTQVRQMVLGDVDRRPSDEELQRMKALVREAMEAGAIGVSTALIYPPAVYARTEEIAALVAVAGEHGGRYYTHMRNEGDRLLEAIDEALDIGASGKAAVHIFHLKAAGRQNWGKMQLAIAKIKAARAAGQQVTADIYPYVNNGLGIAAFIHPRHFSGGRERLLRRLGDEQLRAEIRREIETTDGWENWYRHVGHDWDRVVIGQTNDRRYADLTGSTIAAIAEAKNEDPWDTFFQLARSGAFALPRSMTDANKILAMQQDFVSFCTDVGPAGGSRIASHPRAFGSFPRLLSRYVRDLGAISLERAIAQTSAAACNDVFAYDRGRIATGLAADVIVFDYENLSDNATFADPDALSSGMKYVVVNGSLVWDDGKFTGKRPGRVLRGPGYRDANAPHNAATGQAVDGLASFDRMIRDFMQQHRIPGAALAVTDGGRLVLARGYGYADVASREPVTPTSLFRIASISKPVTATAILQLVDRGKLKLDDKVFDILDYESEIKSLKNFERRLRQITIRHLLEHRGGWDRAASFDGMFQSVRFARQTKVAPPAGPHDVIRAMLSQPLDFDPGERYAYSNFGYCLLGRVIEKLTSQRYEEYVRQQVLAPLGIESMRIGQTRTTQPNEVRYYAPGRDSSVFARDVAQQVPAAYGAWYLEAMDAHGGWIASVTDLARFAMGLDDPQNDLLSPQSRVAMHARPPGLAGHDESGEPKPVYYSLGWMNRVVDEGKVNHWHTGSLDGTATILIRRHDGRNFIVLFNARSSPHASHFGTAIDPLLHRVADDQVNRWP